MKRNRIVLAAWILLLSMFAGACSMVPQASAPGFNLQAAYTAGAETMQALGTPLQTATAIPTTTPTPTRTPLPTAAPATQAAWISPTGVMSTMVESTATGTPVPPQVLFRDDFSEIGGWPYYHSNHYLMGYVDGAYVMQADLVTGDSPIFSIRQHDYGDATYGVEIVRATGENDDYFGLICRWQDSFNYYRFTIGLDGSYEIGVKKEGKYSKLISGPTQEFDPKGTNQLEASCVGNHLSLYLNGKLLGSTQDNTFSSGYAGLVIGTRSYPGLDVMFDNYMVSKP